MICDADIEEVQLRKDDNTTNLYNAAVAVGTWFLRNKYPDQEVPKGALRDAFHLPYTKLQIKTFKEREEWEQEKKLAEEDLNIILRKWVPESYTFLREKIKEKEEQIIFELALHRKNKEEQIPLLCLSCLSIESMDKMKEHHRWGTLCERCRRYGEHLLFPELIDEEGVIWLPKPLEWNQPFGDWGKRKKKSQGQRQREKRRKEMSN
jgi:hypothetical protein